MGSIQSTRQNKENFNGLAAWLILDYGSVSDEIRGISIAIALPD
jgi:hypothetical protein